MKVWAPVSKTPPDLALRSRIILESVRGLDGKSIAARLSVSELAVASGAVASDNLKCAGISNCRQTGAADFSPYASKDSVTRPGPARHIA